MIESFIIKNFRLFKELNIDRLSRLNLFVGKNNSGKSCLLEAFQIYSTKGNPDVLYNLTFARDEDWQNMISEKKGVLGGSPTELLGYLFYGYHLPRLDEEFIEIGTKEDKEKRIIIRHRSFQVVQDDAGRIRRIPIEEGAINDEIVNIERALESVQGDKQCYYIKLEPNFILDPIIGQLIDPIIGQLNRILSEATPERIEKRSSNGETSINFQLVPTKNIREDKLYLLWDSINLTDLGDEVLSCLKIIDSNILGIALVGDSISGLNKIKRVPIVRYKGVDERIPLKTLGDGITRLFHIILALVNAKNGLLLIDEFENGLHWSIHREIWESILRLAEELDVQVIATTHSRDCIKGFYEVWSSNQDKGAFHRLEAEKDSKVNIIPYTCETLSDAFETDVEVR